MKIRVLGSAAGGGFPQWNCGCFNCREGRRSGGRARPRTQESVAISADGESWFLINASPEIRAQIEACPELWPRAERHSPIAGILLTNGDLDHCLGLLSLRESHPLTLYATDAVRAGFTEGNVLYRTLERFPEQVTWRRLAARAAAAARGLGSDLRGHGDPRAGKAAAAPRGAGPAPAVARGQRRLRHSRAVGHARLAYFSGIAGPSPEVEQALADADVVFFDGTFWSSDELVAAGLGTRTAEEMAHWPIGGPGGSLRFLSRPATDARSTSTSTTPTRSSTRTARSGARSSTRASRSPHDGLELEL